MAFDINLQGSKPWRYTGKEENMQRDDIKMLVEKWWDIYADESLDYGNDSKEEKTSVPVLSEAGVIQHVTAPSAA